MSEPARAKVLAHRLGYPLVLAEHHAAQKRGLVRPHARHHRAFRPLAHPIEQAGRAAPPPAGQAGPI
jgi:hypothetical protein